jgi:DNA polymerase/3'-5' exonuclease PolX
MKYLQALKIANDIVEQLSPNCDRIEIAGSIRRKKTDVKDIEIVCIPKKVVQKDLFGNIVRQIPAANFIATINQWKKIKGSPEGKYTQRLLPEGIALDLFTATFDNWGYIYAMRTGSADFSHQVLARGWTKNGYHGQDGMLLKDGELVLIMEEEDLFQIAGVELIPPEERNIYH